MLSSVPVTLRGVNRNGHSTTLTPFREGNTAAAKHGIWSERLREPRTRELYDALMAAPHIVEGLDAIIVMELARVQAFIEVLEHEFYESLNGRSTARTKMLGDLYLRAVGRETALLDRCGLSPLARAKWAKELATGGIGAAIRKRLEEVKRADG